jgi:hypothetical protein
MAPKFGNYLFRNLKGQIPEESADPSVNQSDVLGALEEQTIVLQSSDIETDGPSAPHLNWPKVGERGVEIQLRDTKGILEGRVTVKASVLFRVCPVLFDSPPENEHLFPVSLKTVVLQIQAHLKKYQRDTAKPTGPDFDTPIAQVAREDEGFFKLEENATKNEPVIKESKPQNQAGPILTPADRPKFPFIREKPYPIESNSPSESEALPVSVRPPIPSPPIPNVPRVAMPEKPKIDLFKDLPKVGSRSVPPRSEAPSETGKSPHSVTSSETSIRPVPNAEPTLSKPLRRMGLERLQEIFLTDDLLDARQVARLVSELPRVKGTLILYEDGNIMGGELPPGFHMETAVAAPAFVRAVQQFAEQLNGREVSGLTILGNLPVSLFAHGSVTLIIEHEGRGLLPGMRERMAEVVRALHVLYDGLTIES